MLKLTKSFLLTLAVFALGVVPAFAQSYRYSDPTPTAAAEGMGVFAIVMVCMYCLFILFGIYSFFISLFMLLDIAHRPFFENKTLWIVLIFLFSGIAATIYFFTSRRTYKISLEEEHAHTKKSHAQKSEEAEVVEEKETEEKKEAE